MAPKATTIPPPERTRPPPDPPPAPHPRHRPRHRRRQRHRPGNRPRNRPRQRPPRPPEVQPAPVRRRRQHSVRWRVPRQPEQRPPDGDLLPRPPRHRPPELHPVQRRGHTRIRRDLAPALLVDADEQRPRRHRRVADADRRGAAADVRPPGADPVDRPGVGPARHQDLDQARRLRGHAAVGAAEADHAAVPDRRLGQRQPPPYPLTVDIQRTARRRPPRNVAAPAPDAAPAPGTVAEPHVAAPREPLKLPRHRRHRRPRIGVKHDVRRSPHRGGDHRHQQPHKSPQSADCRL